MPSMSFFDTLSPNAVSHWEAIWDASTLLTSAVEMPSRADVGRFYNLQVLRYQTV